MKLHQALIVATLSLSVLVGDTYAQDSDKRMFGNGRFLKKMRDDIFGTKPKKDSPAPYQSRNSTPKRNPLSLSVKGKGNVPTPALPSDGQRPAAIDSKSTYQHRSPQSQAKRSLAANSKSAQYQKPTTIRNKPQARPTQNSTLSPQVIESVTRSGKKQTLAFGMLLETRGENLVVTNIDPNGNANKAGIRKGDMILGAGGLELGSMLEFNEITDVLRSGDQLEFVVSRSGKKDKKLILFGEAPDMTPKEVAQSNGTSPSNAVGTGAARRSANLNQYQIAPASNNMHSVIESSGNQFAPKQTYQPKNPAIGSGRRVTDQQIEALESASVRGETILNVPN